VNKLLLLILILLFPAGLGLAQWYVSYQNGVKAVQQGEWQQALAHLNAAINNESDSKANKRTYGLTFIDYFPYLYRGVAYYNLKDLVKARADLEKAKSEGEIEDPKWDTGAPALLSEYLGLLQKPAPQTAQQKSPQIAQEKPPPVVQQKPSGNSGENAQSDRKKPDVLPAGKSNENVGKSIASTARPKENPPAPHESVRESSAPSADTTGSSLFREAVALLNSGRIGQAKSAFQHVRAVAPRYPELEAYLGTIAAFEEKTHTGISAFFRGEYTEAIENLSATSKNGSDNPHVYAFLACSYAAEYLLAGAENGNLKKEAVAAFGKVKGIDPRYELDAELISPGIIALLKGE
jgi:tetratricopeptide (TPR) repeat protein